MTTPSISFPIAAGPPDFPGLTAGATAPTVSARVRSGLVVDLFRVLRGASGLRPLLPSLGLLNSGRASAAADHGVAFAALLGAAATSIYRIGLDRHWDLFERFVHVGVARVWKGCTPHGQYTPAIAGAVYAVIQT